ncbi:RNA chaperone Hfq (plasmid) [Cupriavidus necator]|nr:RNA chaperone Hfq [Cupriavidus necator]
MPSLIRDHPFKDDSLNYRLVTVSNRGSTLIVSFDQFVVVLSAPNGSTQAVYKSAISTIQLHWPGRQSVPRVRTARDEAPYKEADAARVVTRMRRPARTGGEGEK